jgi:tetratricopeptide (TPR) repeat protein
MIKAASIPLTLSLLCVAVTDSFSQAPPQEAATNEAIYRQANRITLRQRLLEAQAAQQRGDYPTAAKLYDVAWDLLTRIGSGVEAEAEQTRAGLATVRLELARSAQRRGDLREARTQIADVLRVDPANPAAIELQAENERRMREEFTKMPSEEAQQKYQRSWTRKARRPSWFKTVSFFLRWGSWTMRRPS